MLLPSLYVDEKGNLGLFFFFPLGSCWPVCALNTFQSHRITAEKIWRSHLPILSVLKQNYLCSKIDFPLLSTLDLNYVLVTHEF